MIFIRETPCTSYQFMGMSGLVLTQCLGGELRMYYGIKQGDWIGYGSAPAEWYDFVADGI